MAKYPGEPLDTGTISLDFTMPKINNVEESFKNLPENGDYIRFDPDQTFNNVKLYGEFNIKTLLEKRNSTHFQGAVRSYDGRHIFLSGGDKENQFSQLFVFEAKSHLENLSTNSLELRKGRAIGSNIVSGKEPPAIDKLVRILKLKGGKFWHAGGMSVVGNVLSVAIENADDNKSEIRFYDVTNPTKPIDLGDKAAISDTFNRAGGASFVRIPNGHFLCGVWTDANDYDSKNRRLTMFYSETTDLTDGWKRKTGGYLTARWPYTALHSGTQPQYQSIQLLLEDQGHLYFAGIENSAKLSPIATGKNRIRLYKIEFPGQDINDPGFDLKDVNLRISKVLTEEYPDGKIFPNGKKQYNFDAGSGFYVTPDGGLAFYATHHYLREGFINMVECYEHHGDSEIKDVEESIIELYEHKNYEGRCLRIYGKRNSHLTDYNSILVNDGGFDDKVSSLKYKIPQGKSYELYEDANFNMGTQDGHKKNFLTLVGTGKWVEHADLSKTSGLELFEKKSFDDKVSSSTFRVG